MDIQQTYAFLESNYPKIILEYFKKQIVLFQVNPSSKLKDYLDFINNNAVHWLQSLPDVQSKSGFHKYKDPIYKLIKHNKLYEDYGENYCATLLNTMKQAFTNECQRIIDERKALKTTHVTLNLDDDDSSETTSEPTLDINSIQPIEPSHNDNTDNETSLQAKYDALLREHEHLQIKYECSQAELSRVWKLLHK